MMTLMSSSPLGLASEGRRNLSAALETVTVQLLETETGTGAGERTVTPDFRRYLVRNLR